MARAVLSTVTMQLTSLSPIPRRLTRRLPPLAGLVPVAILAACVAGCQSDDAEEAVADASSSLTEQDVQRLRDVVRPDPLTPELASACPSSRSLRAFDLPARAGLSSAVTTERFF